MDLVDTLRKKIDVLDEGEYLPGLRAVLLHIETAFKHLSRGQDHEDDTAFTDAIYRTNQAFEGSIKEAYRVLAGRDPAKERPFDIEKYLEQNDVFRPRVLTQLTTYRTEWRNPSTHDYKLDFDESEAFLAIVTVSAFACLLLDQIAERLSYARSQAETEAQKESLDASLEKSRDADLLFRVSDLLAQFCAMHVPSTTTSGRPSEPQIVGALSGFLSSAAPELTVDIEVTLKPERPYRADLLVTREGERLLIELKRGITRKNYLNAVAQVEHYLLIGDIKKGILLVAPDGPSEMDRLETSVGGIDARIVVLTPPDFDARPIPPQVLE